MYKRVKPAEIGQRTMLLNRVYAGNRDPRLVAKLTEFINAAVDDAKGCLETRDESLANVRKEAKKMPMPMAIAYAKSSPFVEGSLKEAMKGKEITMNSVLDKYSQSMMKMIPEALEIPTDIDNFEIRYLMSVKTVCKVNGLCGGMPLSVSDKYRDANGNIDHLRAMYDGEEGFFDAMAYTKSQQASEYRELFSDKPEVEIAWTAEKVAGIKRIILEQAAKHDVSVDVILSYLVFYVYTKKENSVTLQRLLWECFGN